MTMSKHTLVKEVHLLAIFTTITSLVFWAFFTWSKTEQFAAVNPFAIDPYDAIGSFAFQIAVAISLLTLARSFQQRNTTISLHRLPFILRGMGIALVVTVITILGDGIAVATQSSLVTSSASGRELLIGLGVLTLFTISDGVGFILFLTGRRRSLSLYTTSKGTSSLGEALHDVYLMVLHPLAKMFPPVEKVDQWVKNHAKGFAWISPYTHPWRFMLGVGIVLGLLINAADFLKEGLPPHIQVALIVMTIFILGELGATLLSFLLFGGFLGLRPPLFKNNKECRK